MRVYKFTNLSPVFLSIFIAAICMFGISAASTHAATFTVANTNDSGPGTLRQAIIDADVLAGDTSLIDSATVQIAAVGGGGTGGVTASAVTFYGGSVGGTRTACFTSTERSRFVIDA